jgi:folate-dependent phosphoribosylglycinamide formyltransferase PurN
MESNNKLRVIILTHGGAELVLEKIAAFENVGIVGVFIETETTPNRSFKEKLRRSIRYDGYWATFTKFGAKLFGQNTEGAAEEQTLREGQNKFAELAEKHGVPVHYVRNYHDESSIELIKHANADLGIIYGTNIIKEKVFALPRLGSINLHQGWAQLYRGGPPVFWELFNDEKEVGLTVHYVAAKVDTGDIIVQDTAPLNYDFAGYGLDYDRFLADFRAGLTENCANLVAEAVRLIADSNAPRIPQDTSQGKRYRLPVKAEKDEMKRRLHERQKAFKNLAAENIETVS